MFSIRFSVHRKHAFTRLRHNGPLQLRNTSKVIIFTRAYSFCFRHGLVLVRLGTAEKSASTRAYVMYITHACSNERGSIVISIGFEREQRRLVDDGETDEISTGSEFGDEIFSPAVAEERKNRYYVSTAAASARVCTLFAERTRYRFPTVFSDLATVRACDGIIVRQTWRSPKPYDMTRRRGRIKTTRPNEIRYTLCGEDDAAAPRSFSAERNVRDELIPITVERCGNMNNITAAAAARSAKILPSSIMGYGARRAVEVKCLRGRTLFIDKQMTKQIWFELDGTLGRVFFFFFFM